MSAELSQPLPFLRRRSAGDFVFALLIAGGALFAWRRYGGAMDAYERVILFAAASAFIVLGWSWRKLQALAAAIATLSLLAIFLYHGDLARGEQTFLLKYVLSSQSAILWMSALFMMATGAYWLGILAGSAFAARSGSLLTWCAATLGLSGMLVRWYESYLIGADIGHIPISNLYEVFVLFCMITALFWLYYEERYAARTLGAFVLSVVSAAVGFLLWYTFSRDASEIQPLVPALQSWWMKLHVPANFIGYGSFALAAMTAVAYLLPRNSRLAARLPRLEVLDEVMYRSIAVGFAFFTIATILGSLWAADSWGTYWQWDPKETWALIVWLNYAAWLHMRQLRGLRGPVLAWWALGGLLVTTFAFLGVNLFLSGLHSYGQL